jgi:hypothetical protein
MRSRIAFALGVAGLLALGSLYAGQSPAEVLKAKIDFPFMVGGKAMPAGTYEIRKDDAAPVFRIQGAGKTGDVVNIITELSAEERGNLSSSSLVFDVAGGKYVLSEVWIPGANGYLLEVTKGHHAHKVVKIEK